MGLNIQKVIMKFIFVLFLMPGLVFASTEFKGKETVNINRADAPTMAAYLKGIGANKAEAIVKYRKANGKFSKIEDIKNVPGIGDETYKDIRKNVSTSRGKATAPDGYKMDKSSGKSKSAKKKTTTKSKSSKKTSSTSSSSAKKTKSSKTSDSKSTKAKKTSKSKKSESTKKTKSKSKTKKPTTKKKTTKKKKTKKEKK